MKKRLIWGVCALVLLLGAVCYYHSGTYTWDITYEGKRFIVVERIVYPFSYIALVEYQEPFLELRKLAFNAKYWDSEILPTFPPRHRPRFIVRRNLFSEDVLIFDKDGNDWPEKITVDGMTFTSADVSIWAEEEHEWGGKGGPADQAYDVFLEAGNLLSTLPWDLDFAKRIQTPDEKFALSERDTLKLFVDWF